MGSANDIFDASLNALHYAMSAYHLIVDDPMAYKRDKNTRKSEESTDVIVLDEGQFELLD